MKILKKIYSIIAFIKYTIVPNFNIIALFLTSLGFAGIFKIAINEHKTRKKTRCLFHYIFYFHMKK